MNKDAFDFPRKSGKIIANYQDNVFQIKISCIKSFQIKVSPEMIHTNKKIKIYKNGILYFNDEMKYNREFMIQSFEESKDRTQIWINFIELQL